MEDDDGYNSSDVDFGPPPPNPFANAGRASIEAMIQSATEDRLTSKRFSKNLQFSRGRKTTQYRNDLWFRRFATFRQFTLRVREDQTPTGEQLERFLETIVNKVKPKSLEVPSYEWLKAGFRHLRLALVFHYSKFTLSKHDSSRISSVFDIMLQEGRLTTEPSQHHNWVGVYILRQIVTAMFQDALCEGTLSWDVTLSKCTSIVLTSALSCRAGDITTDPLDDQPLPFLCYRDITMRLLGGEGVENIIAEVVIRNEKFKKRNQQENRTVILHCLGSENVMCPIKLLLILALRSGNIDAAVSIEQVIAKAQSRRDRKVIWKNPLQPVVCAITPQGAALQLNKPAHRTQISRNIADGGLLAGVLAPLTSHDLRRGAARDIANMKHSFKGLATEAIATVLGHSKKAYDRGTTARYVGPASAELWQPRVQESFDDPYGLEVTSTLYLKRKKLGTNEVTALCVDQGLDPGDVNSRQRVAYHHKRLRRNEWIKGELETSAQIETSAQVDATDFNKISPQIDAGATNALDFHDSLDSRNGQHSRDGQHSYDGRHSRDTLESRDVRHSRDALDSSVDAHNLYTSNAVNSSGGSLVSRDVIDPSLWGSPPKKAVGIDAADSNKTNEEENVENLENMLANTDDFVITELMEEAVFDQVLDALPSSTTIGFDAVLLGAPFDFISYFAKINVTRNQRLIRQNSEASGKLTELSTNGRDKVSFMQFHCRNTGCKYQSGNTTLLKSHEKFCKVGAPPKNKDGKEHAFPCNILECSSGFNTQKRLDAHVREYHEWKPRECSMCDMLDLFQTPSQYRDHMKRARRLAFSEGNLEGDAQPPKAKRPRRGIRRLSRSAAYSPQPNSEPSPVPSNLSKVVLASRIHEPVPDTEDETPVPSILAETAYVSPIRDPFPAILKEGTPVLERFPKLGITSRVQSPMSLDSINPYESPDPDSPMPCNNAESDSSIRLPSDADLSPALPKEILCIGHSDLPLSSLIQLLKHMDVSHLVDVRSRPVSETSPQFNFSRMRTNFDLMGANIEYLWLGVSLGGRREHMQGVIKHKEMLVPDLQQYAAYMTTPEFKAGLAELKQLATEQAKIGKKVAIMCGEAVHWRCHRRMIADRLVADNWTVRHMGLRAKESVEHKMWNIARVALNGEVYYDLPRLVY
ncbi:hypothetical protein V493_05304 [Pseudogymnoascus sp. VKM F-4281 (FW-2241)]|nr:hypothetical protein V493_05304 [Pseudogymnoascus sp. VKM F-4281 (FW-2241)]